MKFYFLDTNVFIYAFGREHYYKEPCRRVLSLIAHEEIFSIINTEVIQEILYYCWKTGKRELGSQIARNLFKIIPQILSIEREDMVLSLALLERYKTLPPRDAVHAASMIRNGQKYLISTDKHFDIIKELQRENPVDVM